MLRIMLMLTRLCLLALVALWGGIGWRVATDPNNHIGWSPLWMLPLAAAAAAFSLLVWSRTKDRVAVATVVVAAASMLGLYLLDHFAVLMAYESWIARGMPAPPF
jgi:hypothetical protein